MQLSKSHVKGNNNWANETGKILIEMLFTLQPVKKQSPFWRPLPGFIAIDHRHQIKNHS
jgi:hypothetical protein